MRFSSTLVLLSLLAPTVVSAQPGGEPDDRIPTREASEEARRAARLARWEIEKAELAKEKTEMARVEKWFDSLRKVALGRAARRREGVGLGPSPDSKGLERMAALRFYPWSRPYGLEIEYSPKDHTLRVSRDAFRYIDRLHDSGDFEDTLPERYPGQRREFVRVRLTTFLLAEALARIAGFPQAGDPARPKPGSSYAEALRMLEAPGIRDDLIGLRPKPELLVKPDGSPATGWEAEVRAMVRQASQSRSSETAPYDPRARRRTLATDSSVVRLHDLLAGSFPGCRANHTKAALKLHAVMNVNSRGAKSFRITSERTNDGKALLAGKWLKDRLILFDLGYYRYQLFDCLRRNGGFFLSRLKVNANPTIVAVHRLWRGASVPLVGEKLQDAIARLRREEIDVEIEVEFKRRKYAGKRSSGRQRFRLVGIRNEETGDYHLYVTNLPPDRLSARAVAAIYRARWTVEQLFESLKSDFALEDMPSANKHVALTLVYAAIVTWIASRELRLAVRARLGDQARRVTEGRWTRLLRTWASFLLLLVTTPPRYTGELTRRVEAVLLAEAADPHRNRQSLLEEVEAGIPFGRRSAQV